MPWILKSCRHQITQTWNCWIIICVEMSILETLCHCLIFSPRRAGTPINVGIVELEQQNRHYSVKKKGRCWLFLGDHNTEVTGSQMYGTSLQNPLPGMTKQVLALILALSVAWSKSLNLSFSALNHIKPVFLGLKANGLKTLQRLKIGYYAAN